MKQIRQMIKSIQDFWSSDSLDMNNYDPKNNREKRYILVVIDNYSKIGWTISLKNKYAQSIRDKRQIFKNYQVIES